VESLQVEWQVLAGWLAHWLAGRLAGLLAGWLAVDRSAGWLEEDQPAWLGRLLL
jgi:uncharacterized membrane protein YeaQ/YmgE (transglycosylase-associated protein family)